MRSAPLNLLPFLTIVWDIEIEESSTAFDDGATIESNRDKSSGTILPLLFGKSLLALKIDLFLIWYIILISQLLTMF